MHQLIKTKAVLQIFLVITLSIFTSLSFAQPVEAQEVCCAQTAESFCQQADITECTGDTYYAGSCESFTACQVGCCDLTGQGQSCTQATTKVACETQGGTFLPDELCNYNQCEPVCCQVGSQFDYTSQQECNNYAAQYPDLQPQIHEVGSELECLELSTLQQTGCCSTQETCSQQTRAECQAMTGTFFEEELCSNVFTPSCNVCEPQAETACVEGSDDIWYFDSCGNKEGIAQTCDVLQGKVCGAGENGQAACIDINCADTWDNPVVDYDGGKKFNGESWCEYDANAGPTLDLPGSRHYRHYCYNGKELVEPCEGYREQVCIQGTANTPNGPRSIAECRDNRAESCYAQINKESCENREIRDCIWLNPAEEAVESFIEDTEESIRDVNVEDEESEEQTEIIIGEKEAGNCIPLVPLGNAFWEETENMLCDAMDLPNEQTGTQAYWRKDPSWNCKTGCLTYTQGFFEGTNSLCRAQADCGAAYNVVGTWSPEGMVRTTDFPSNQNEEIQGLGDINDKTLEGTDYYKGKVTKLLEEGEATTLNNPNTFENSWAFYAGGLYAGEYDFNELTAAALGEWATAKGAMTTIGGIAGTLALSMLVTSVSTIATAVAGISVAGSATAGLTTAAAVSASGGLPGLIVSLVLLIAAATVLIISLTIKDHQATNTFDCRVWQAPSGGQDCNLCQDDERLTANGLHECTEYLCKSLGAACDFIPDTPDGPVCINTPQIGEPMRSSLNPPNKCYANQEGTIPAECTLQETVSGHTYTTYIGANQKVSWGVTTEDYATCRYDTRRVAYGEMTGHFDQGGFTKQHNKTLFPSQDIWPSESYSFYVHCQNSNEEATTHDYKVEFTVADQEDLEVPIITEYSITPGSYTAADKDEIDLTITINEQVANGGGCKWAKTNVAYQEMGNHFNCPNPGLTDQQCTTTLGPLENQTNMFYFRCEDDKFPEGNINAESQPTNGYTLVRTQPLEINNVFCQTEFGTDCANIESNEFTLTVQTQGGAQSGKATCGLGYNDIEATFDMFQTTETSTHTQNLEISDEYFIFCTDIAQNVATTSINAQITFDYNAPIIEETFVEQGHLVVTTNEDATCKWTREAEFNFVEAQPFIQTDTKRHTIAATNEYVQVACQDKFGNTSPTHHIYINEL